MMKYFIALVLLTLSIYSFGQVEIKVKTVPVKLEQGSDILYKLDFKPSTAVQIVDPKVAEVTFIPQRKEISINALKKGRTNIRLRDEKGTAKLVFAVNVK